MATSIIVLAQTEADAISYAELRCPNALCHGTVQRVFEVGHLIVNWPCQTVSIIEKHKPDESKTCA